MHAVATDWHDKRSRIFDGGGIWSGGAANAGNASVQQRIREMNSLGGHLGKGYAYYHLTAEIVVQTKNSINRNLQAAQTVIQDLRASPDFSEATKQALIKMYVAWQNSLNTAAVAAAAGQVGLRPSRLGCRRPHPFHRRLHRSRSRVHHHHLGTTLHKGATGPA